MTDSLQRQRAVASLAAVRHHKPHVLADAFRAADLRYAIRDALDADGSANRFTKSGLQTLADHFGIEYDRFTSGRDLRRELGWQCNFDYDEYASQTFTKDQLAHIAVQLARDGAFDTERDNPTMSAASSRQLPSKTTLLSIGLAGAMFGGGLWLTQPVANALKLAVNTSAMPDVVTSVAVPIFGIVLLLLVGAAFGPRRSFQ